MRSVIDEYYLLAVLLGIVLWWMLFGNKVRIR